VNYKGNKRVCTPEGFEGLP